MKTPFTICLSLLAGILISSCQDQPNELKKHPPATAELAKTVEFSDPVVVIVNTDTTSFRLKNSKAIELHILKANELSVDIAFIPLINIKFITESGREIPIDRKTLSDGQMIFFNGNQLLFTSPEESSPDELDKFIHKGDDSGKNGKKKIITEKDEYGKGYTSNISKDNPEFVGIADQHKEISSINKMITIVSGHPFIYSSIDTNLAIVRNPYFNSYISTVQSLTIALDNDLFNNTDRYYTNGVKIKYQSPAFAFWKINSILPVSEKNSIEYNSLELNHYMFTPYTTKDPPLLKDDRPYASALLVRFMRMAENADKESIQKAYIDIGVIGQAALGGLMQEGVHATLPSNDEPLGWETQIANDLILNYGYEYIRKIFSVGHLHTYSLSSLSLGTLITDFSTGIGFRIGTNNEFVTPLPDTYNFQHSSLNENFDFSFETNFYTSVVGYNATLNGGLLNKHNIYVLKPNEIERLIFNGEAIISASYGDYGISLAQYFISNEFKKGKNHYWGQIGLKFEF